MGYVLPIQPYQYNDYQNRVMKDKQDPFYIEKPYKIIFDAKHRDILQSNSEQEIAQPSDKPQQVFQPKKSQVDKIYATITGKGRHFSESI
ncbi:hypothetical protein [Virgibacillus oceani]|uniref:Uncharacterized protein n=1 Tax=Virgibacillus oceani TaxID=1479511 RepID=A0A917HG86_9BACI|nr:hypothetical protein [Virgibacillus oceani]GGG78221.1 hypothetical protein GCM10011398_24300 [Virgibacillus oceani]